jgi:hypothetical protein
MGRLSSLTLLVSLLVGVEPAFAKRAAPVPVPPIVYNGITYSAPNRDGRAAYVVATDSSSGQQLFRVKIFDVAIDPKLEEDVQWIFINGLKLSGNSLFVKDERGRCFSIDLGTKKVKKEFHCGF